MSGRIVCRRALSTGSPKWQQTVHPRTQYCPSDHHVSNLLFFKASSLGGTGSFSFCALSVRVLAEGIPAQILSCRASSDDLSPGNSGLAVSKSRLPVVANAGWLQRKPCGAAPLEVMIFQVLKGRTPVWPSETTFIKLNTP